MKRVFAAALGLAVVGLVGLGRADDQKDDAKDFAKKVVGKWEITKAGNPNGAQAGSTLDFAKDGKLKVVVVTGNGRKIPIAGTYTVEKDKLTSKAGPEGMEEEEVLTITKLTDDAMELKDKDGGVDVLKRVKEDKKEPKKDD